MFFIAGYEHAGLSQLIYDTIMSIDIHVRRDIYVNIILAGGSTLFPGRRQCTCIPILQHALVQRAVCNIL